MNLSRFRGVRDGDDISVTVDGKPLKSRADLRAHADDFAWGETSHGASQLALAITAKVLGDETALACYHDFKFEVLARFRADEWTLDAESVRLWYGGWIKAQDTARTANVYSHN